MSCAQVAQLVEQRTENPRVTSSSLVPGINFAKQCLPVFLLLGNYHSDNYLF